MRSARRSASGRALSMGSIMALILCVLVELVRGGKHGHWLRARLAVFASLFAVGHRPEHVTLVAVDDGPADLYLWLDGGAGHRCPFARMAVASVARSARCM